MCGVSDLKATHGRATTVTWVAKGHTCALGDGCRWLKQGHNATADIFLRHLRVSPDDPHETRNLARAGVDPDQHLVDTNHRNNLPTEVAITHGRCGAVDS